MAQIAIPNGAQIVFKYFGYYPKYRQTLKDVKQKMSGCLNQWHDVTKLDFQGNGGYAYHEIALENKYLSYYFPFKQKLKMQKMKRILFNVHKQYNSQHQADSYNDNWCACESKYLCLHLWVMSRNPEIGCLQLLHCDDIFIYNFDIKHFDSVKKYIAENKNLTETKLHDFLVNVCSATY